MEQPVLVASWAYLRSSPAKQRDVDTRRGAGAMVATRSLARLRLPVAGSARVGMDNTSPPSVRHTGDVRVQGIPVPGSRRHRRRHRRRRRRPPCQAGALRRHAHERDAASACLHAALVCPPSRPQRGADALHAPGVAVRAASVPPRSAHGRTGGVSGRRCDDVIAPGRPPGGRRWQAQGR